MQRIHFILLLLTSFIVSEDSLDSVQNKASEILDTIISSQSKSIAFNLSVDMGKTKTVIDVNILSLKNNTIVFEDDIGIESKIFLQFHEPKAIKNMHSWIWSFNTGKNKMWITKPKSGRLTDVTNEKNMLGIDFSLFQLDSSMSDGFKNISDTILYNGKQCYLLNFYEVKKQKKIGPIMKLWIDTIDYKVYKIEKFTRKRKKINEIIFESYVNDFPSRIKINNMNKKNNLIIDISNYREMSFEDLSIFEPRDIKK